MLAGFDLISIFLTSGYRGAIQLFSLAGHLVGFLRADHIHQSVNSGFPPSWGLQNVSHWPTDLTKGILPKRCHSHNDYWREVPLYSALQVGCIGVEADVWLSTGDLYVGHSIASLTPNRTLNKLYINPLLDILSKQNQKALVLPDDGVSPPHGIYDTDPQQPLVLLVDFKTDGVILFPFLVSALEPLRSKHYLTYRNGTEIIQGPITVVGTGNAPFDLVTSDTVNPHHDIFFDAPLDEVSESLDKEISPITHPMLNKISSRNVEQTPYNSSHCYYASVSFKKAFGEYHNGELSMEQLSNLRDQVRGAHRRGLKTRYWEIPYWPIHVRNHIWEVLMREGVDFLNVDDLKAAADQDWTLPGG